MMRGGRISRHIFTASQCQELEQQFLIYNYVSSGIPIPPDLILLIRRSLMTTISLPTLDFFNPEPTIPVGWMDIGRKAEDPEPWRCRRTDGKKWRCSRKAHTDSKYCERHMHRGKNRSRKLVEMSSVTTSIIPPQYPLPHSMHLHPSSCPELGFACCKNDTHFWPLEMSFLHEPKQRYTTQQRTGSHFKDELTEEKQRHCFVLGADLMLAKPLNVEREEHDRKPKLLSCPLDEGTIKNKEIPVPVDGAYSEFLDDEQGDTRSR